MNADRNLPAFGMAALLCLVGLWWLLFPVSFVRVTARINPMGAIRFNDPEEVQRSFRMRLEWRIAGLFALLLGVGVIWGAK